MFPPSAAVRAHSFELLGRHKARKKRDRGFVWSANKRRRRDRPRDTGRPGTHVLHPSPGANTRRYVFCDDDDDEGTPRFDRNRPFVICLREPKRLSRKMDLVPRHRVVAIIKPHAHRQDLPRDEAEANKTFFHSRVQLDRPCKVSYLRSIFLIVQPLRDEQQASRHKNWHL